MEGHWVLEMKCLLIDQSNTTLGPNGQIVTTTTNICCLILSKQLLIKLTVFCLCILVKITEQIMENLQLVYK